MWITETSVITFIALTLHGTWITDCVNEDGNTGISCQCHQLTHATKSWRRQRFTITCDELVVKRRSSEVNLVDNTSELRRSTVQFFTISQFLDDRYKFWTKYQKKLPLFWKYANFFLTQGRIGVRKFPCQKLARFIHPFRQNTDMWHTHRAIASTHAKNTNESGTLQPWRPYGPHNIGCIGVSQALTSNQ